jgi:hypothetical protein
MSENSQTTPTNQKTRPAENDYAEILDISNLGERESEEINNSVSTFHSPIEPSKTQSRRTLRRSSRRTNKTRKRRNRYPPSNEEIKNVLTFLLNQYNLNVSRELFK